MKVRQKEAVQNLGPLLPVKGYCLWVRPRFVPPHGVHFLAVLILPVSLATSSVPLWVDLQDWNDLYERSLVLHVLPKSEPILLFSLVVFVLYLFHLPYSLRLAKFAARHWGAGNREEVPWRVVAFARAAAGIWAVHGFTIGLFLVHVLLWR